MLISKCKVIGPESKNVKCSYDLGGLIYNEITLNNVDVSEHLNIQAIITLQTSAYADMTWGMGNDLRNERLLKDHFILTPAGFPHLSGWHNACSFSNFFIYPDFFERVNQSFQQELPFDLVPKFNFQDAFLKKIFQLIQLELHSMEVADPLYVDSLLIMLGKHLNTNFRIDETKVSRLSGKQLFVIESYIKSNLGKAIRLDELASLVNMSQYHFSRLFKAKTGIAPYQYVQDIRLAKASELLSKTTLTISEIAFRCGYNSPSHFTAQFKKRIGISPQTARGKY
ncbi:MAG: AraC family transcriptional regulator [Bacteroidota bacterium]